MGHSQMASSSAHSLKTLPLQTGIVYGPVRSRRLGLSLGINLLPTKYKLCSFNCVYCQYGWTRRPTLAPVQELKDLPSVEEVVVAVEKALRHLSQRERNVNSLSICGNGEPTLDPQLREVVEALKELRNRYLPDARLAIFSNSSTVGNAQVRATLDRFDLKIMKFDAGSEELFRQLNHPVTPIYIGEVVAGLKQLNNIILQSMFVQGRLTNADPDSVDLWVQKVGEIMPLRMQVYTLDRAPADQKLAKVNGATLRWIANQIYWRLGTEVDVF
jgi:wyosine [tRNA(Phe)-imidazoG37] synthetase (radical SAM superfamily)